MIAQADKQRIEAENWPPRTWTDGSGDKHEFLKVSYVLSGAEKFIFIHIPKTAGMSIHRGVIDELIPDAVTYPDLSEPIYADQWDDYFKFTIVRNPWDRMVSCWKYNPSKVIPEGTSFEDFITKYAWDEAGDPINKHWLEQSVFLGDDTRTWVDYIGRFEKLDEAWNEIRPRIGLPTVDLPHINKSASRKSDVPRPWYRRLVKPFPKSGTYRDYYSARTRRIVARKFERDIEVLRYQF